MTEPRSKRPAGWLRTVICQALEPERPLSGSSLAQKLAREGTAAYHSAVFRALDQLHRAGTVRRVELVAGYLPKADGDTIVCVCSRCGCVVEQANGDVGRALKCLAADRKFAADRFILEVAGTCRDCTTRSSGGVA